MEEQLHVEAARLQLVGGKTRVSALSDGEGRPGGVSSGWGSLYAVSHVISRGFAGERVCDRLEGVAQETYRRSPGGVTNRVRQAVRSANRYLYLRNRVRGDGEALLASLACVAIRGTDAYACGIGPHGLLILSKGRVRDLGNRMAASHLGRDGGWGGNGHFLGRGTSLQDPKFTYRQVAPGDLLIIVTGEDVPAFQRAASALAADCHELDIQEVAQELGRFVEGEAQATALLLRVQTQGVRPEHGVKGREKTLEGSHHLGPSVLSSWRRSRAGSAPEGTESFGGASVRSWTEDLRSSDESAAYVAPSGRWTGEYQERQAANPALSEAQRGRFAQSGPGRLELTGMLLVSLLIALRAAVQGLLGSAVGAGKRSWRWMRRHRVVERLARGFALALAGLWGAFKGLVVGILPERQRTGTTYAASARPMVRAKVLGFHPSGRSRALIGVLILVVVFALLGASILRVKARIVEADVEELASLVEERLQQADLQGDRDAKMAVLAEAQEMIEQAALGQGQSPQLSELSRELEKRWDGLTGVLRLSFAAEETSVAGAQTFALLVAQDDAVYALDGDGQTIHRFALDEQGRLSAEQESWAWNLPEVMGTETDARILDMAWVDASNGRATPALLMLTSQGMILELRADGTIRSVPTAESSRWQNPESLGTYSGNLYVLDLEHENIYKYIPNGDAYENAPADYIQAPSEVDWPTVKDMAIDGFIYLLDADGVVWKFGGGQPQPFTQEGLYPRLTSPAAIFASADGRSIFVAEPELRRIVEFTQDGQFVRQYRAAFDGDDPLGDFSAFAVDVDHGRLIVGTSSGLFSAGLPSLH